MFKYRTDMWLYFVQVVDRFIRRKPITEIVRDFPGSGDRAKRVADIFSTRFNSSKQ